MKNRNAFTLVELLAVIAILAILVIIALPNVMGMFNSAKKNSFMTEVKQIYKVAQQQWINDSMFSTSNQEYGRCNGCSYKELSLTGRKEIKYHIKLDKAGNVIYYKVDDGTYSFLYTGNGLDITSITEDQIVASTGEEVVTSSYVYAGVSNNLRVGSSVPNDVNTYNDYTSAFNGLNYTIFARLKVDNNIISEINIGFLKNGTAYYIRTDNAYDYNSSLLKNLQGESRCTESDLGLYCEDSELPRYFYINNNNTIEVSEDTPYGYGWGCDYLSNDSLKCFTYIYH